MISEIGRDEIYFFDLNGYIILRNVFNEVEIRAMNEVIDRKSSSSQERLFDLRNTRIGSAFEGDGKSGRKDLGEILQWGYDDSKYFRCVLDHPKLVPYYHCFLGRGYRMDHLPLIIAQERGSEGFMLHGGTVDCVTGSYNPEIAFSCVNGRIYNHLLAVSVVLSDHNAGDGGFVIVRGSHKSNFPVPREMIDGLGPGNEFIYQPVTKAGDVILFSEGTVHGAKPWTASHQRRVALYRLSPSTCAYGRSYYPSWPSDLLEHMTERQRAVLEPAYASRLDRPLQKESTCDNNEERGIEVSSRALEKKEFDRKVFGTTYF